MALPGIALPCATLLRLGNRRKLLEQLSLRARRRDAVRDVPRPFALAVECPCIAIVAQVDVDALVDHPRLEPRILHRKGNFDAAKEVAPHPVGRRKPDLVGAAVAEMPDAMMLEKAAENRAYADVVRHSANAGAQRAGTTDDQVDAHSR